LIVDIGGFPLATCSALPLKMFTALLRHSEEQNQSKTAALDALRTNTAEDCTRTQFSSIIANSVRSMATALTFTCIIHPDHMAIA
jgi:hypothetical protein